MNKKALIAIVIALLFPVLCYLAVKQYSDHALAMPPRYFADSVITTMKDGKQKTDTVWHQIQDIRLTNQQGQAVSLWKDNAGKVVVADFFFTHCPSICPLLTANLKRLQDALSTKDQYKELNPSSIRFLSFTVDPERDSVAALKRYATRFGIDPDIWWLLTGPKKEIYDFSFNELKLGQVDGEGVDTSFIHTQKMVLIDKNQVVRGYYNGLDSNDIARLAGDIVFVMLEKDKNYISPLTELKPLIPLFIVCLLLVIALMLLLFRKDKYPGMKPPSKLATGNEALAAHPET